MMAQIQTLLERLILFFICSQAFISAEECDDASLYACKSCFNLNRCDAINDNCTDDCGPCRPDFMSSDSPGAGTSYCKSMTGVATTLVPPRRTRTWPNLPVETQPPPTDVKVINTKTFITGIAVVAMGVSIGLGMMARNRCWQRRDAYSLYDNDGTAIEMEDEDGALTSNNRFRNRSRKVHFAEDNDRYLFDDDSDDNDNNSEPMFQQ
eukprot:TRINITY_DN12279_c0_g1_i1.p3 TRINITY_DN12279_c0_g1~~TRINITY_DN12279_c0_g1_i1.p3  ORF type:complete len:208 (+),score=26.11 TRINITY_DN12279_c0_g1_i1:1-624(+)